jgi:hypothetical protein
VSVERPVIEVRDLGPGVPKGWTLNDDASHGRGHRSQKVVYILDELRLPSPLRAIRKFDVPLDTAIRVAGADRDRPRVGEVFRLSAQLEAQLFEGTML